MVLNIIIPLRKLYHLEDLLPLRYMNNMANVMLVTGWMVTYGYIMEAFMAWYSGDIFEKYMMWNRAFGPYGWVFWFLMLCNVVIPQLLWSRRVRTNMLTLFLVALSINVGMWLERFVIVISSLNRDYVPSIWRMFSHHVGLDDIVWEHGVVSYAAVSFCSLSALDVHFRNSRTRCRGTGGEIMSVENPLHGLMAEFEQPEEVLDAVKRAYQEGYRRMDAYSPFPVEGLAQALGRRGTAVPLIVLIGGIVGGIGGYFMEWYATVVSYKINVGGRPFNSWPGYIPIVFELTVLSAAICAVVGMLALNRLPEPYHAVFNAPGFNRASQDRFFLCIEAVDPKFDLKVTHAFMQSLNPVQVTEVLQ